jgi:type II secretory pathway pseudopilin PulG
MGARMRRPGGAIRGKGGAGGFTYVGLMIVIAIMGVVMAATGEVWLTAQQREKERELLFVGDQFRQAIDGYYEHTPGQALRYPMKLEDLLKDPRHPSTQRYLRRIYRDPVTGGEEWGLVKGPEGEILGVHSLSDAPPLKQGNFNLAERGFEGKTKYADWVFMHVPGQRTAASAQQP